MTDSGAYLGMSKLDTIYFAKDEDGNRSLTTLTASAFKGSLLTSIEIPDTVTTMGNSVFENCAQLKSVKMPSKLTAMGTNTFKSCTSLASCELPATLVTGSSSKLANFTFDGCTALESVTLPGNFGYGNANTFRNCTSLKTVKIIKGTNAYISNAGTTAYTTSTAKYTPWYRMMQNGGGTVYIGEGITTLVNYAFYDCSNLTYKVAAASLTLNNNTALTASNTTYSYTD
jgi:hypothetical protein